MVEMFCDEDEFYDIVVGLCSKCSDICAVVNDFCTVSCPGIYSVSRFIVIRTMQFYCALALQGYVLTLDWWTNSHCYCYYCKHLTR